MKRIEFKQKLIEALMANGIDPRAYQLKSALDKTARHAISKYGSVDWDMEYKECGVENALIFYKEYNNTETFNRERYQNSRLSA